MERDAARSTHRPGRTRNRRAGRDARRHGAPTPSRPSAHPDTSYPAVLHPFLDVPEHVVQPPGRWQPNDPTGTVPSESRSLPHSPCTWVVVGQTHPPSRKSSSSPPAPHTPTPPRSATGRMGPSPPTATPHTPAHHPTTQRSLDAVSPAPAHIAHLVRSRRVILLERYLVLRQRERPHRHLMHRLRVVLALLPERSPSGTTPPE